MKSYHRLFLYIISLLFLFSCKSESNITVYKLKKNKSTVSSTENTNLVSRNLNWNAPNNWSEKPPTNFRLASFDILAKSGEIIDLSITSFPGDAGGIEQNVNRWRRQINLDPQNINTIMNMAKIESSMLGEYYIFDLENNITNQSIIVALIPYLTNENIISETIFIKMGGNYNLMQELKYEFELFCKSIHWSE